MDGSAERLRQRARARAEGWLRRNGTPRFHMLLIVLATGAFGFLCSFLMLKGGVSAMWVRYPLAVVLSYALFLGLLRLWLSYQMTLIPANSRSKSGYDFVDAALDASHFVPSIDDQVSNGHPAGHGSHLLDLDELVWVVVALVALCAALAAGVYVIWTAPPLLAEVMVDGFLMSGIYKKMKSADRSYWMQGVLRRTWLAAVVVTVSFGMAGLAMTKIAPEAKSIGPVVLGSPHPALSPRRG